MAVLTFVSLTSSEPSRWTSNPISESREKVLEALLLRPARLRICERIDRAELSP